MIHVNHHDPFLSKHESATSPKVVIHKISHYRSYAAHFLSASPGRLLHKALNHPPDKPSAISPCIVRLNPLESTVL